ncbi:MAG: tripartite tricarboxylate transporter substrate binding protein [Burkholderiales bacterium]|nr:tripartite tricarboxylate transporter substrate binding protein [Burkholderiales bacterium]MDE1927147.1 tripartite tricarboxylate transporter substrate binding protein [Burkholderiales bacterium]MDE2157957.1 tripartite tricarboxylate transporter substrate binding protein [Burkholderiales bacterium]
MHSRLVKSLGLGYVLAACAAGPAQAAYPDHAIHYVLHVSPGGATDVMARKLSSVLQKELNVPVVVENRPGGRGAAEMAELTHARPDGYTIAAVTSSHLAQFHLTLRQYNVKSVTWLTRLVTEPYLFVVRASSPIHSMKDLAASIRAKPGMVVSGFQMGSGANIAWEMFMASAKLPAANVNWVPYNSVGSGVTAIVGGHGELTVAYYGLVKDQVAAGHLRIIGALAAKRLPELPDVPTLQEQGFDVDSDWDQWRGIVVPDHTPPAVQARLVSAIQQAMNGPDMQAFMKNDSLDEDFAGPKDFTAFVDKQDALTQDWLKRLGYAK